VLVNFVGTDAEYDRIDPEARKPVRPIRTEADYETALDEVF
jgi:hypothetical protein